MKHAFLLRGRCDFKVTSYWKKLQSRCIPLLQDSTCSEVSQRKINKVGTRNLS